MISLSNLKKQRLSSKSKEKLQPLMIGFDGDSQIDVAKSGIKKRFGILEEELRLTGFYTNYWMWNLVFLNILISFILGITVFFSFNSLPSDIGVNVNNDANLDLILDKQWLYLPVLLAGDFNDARHVGPGSDLH